MVEDLAGDWLRLDERIEGVSSEIAALVDQDAVTFGPHQPPHPRPQCPR
jgi:hypothetical protein